MLSVQNRRKRIMADIPLGFGDQTFEGPKNETNTIIGDESTLMGHGDMGGNDTITGGANSTNTIYGDAVHMIGGASGGNDTLIGGKGGINFLIGDASDAAGPMAPIAGNDRLVSAFNTTDHMWGDFQSTGGNAGQDTFVFGPNNGNDFI